MDTPLKEAIERAERRLKLLREKDPQAVFHCPGCGQYFENLANYNELKRCGKCFSKRKQEIMETHVAEVIGGTIKDIKVSEVNPLRIPKEPEITEVIIKTIGGKTVKLKQPEKLLYM